MGIFNFGNLLRRSHGAHFTALIASFRTEIDDPIRALDHFQIVLDHDQRVTGIGQSLENLQQPRDVIEMQTGRRLVEDEKIADCIPIWALDVFCLSQMPNQL